MRECSDDDDPDSLLANESEMSQGPGTSGRRTARALQNFASQNQDSSNLPPRNGLLTDILRRQIHVEWNGTTKMSLNDRVPNETRIRELGLAPAALLIMLQQRV